MDESNASAESENTNKKSRGRKTGTKVFTIKTLYQAVKNNTLANDISSGNFTTPTIETIDFVRAILIGSKETVPEKEFAALETIARSKEANAAAAKAKSVVSFDKPIKINAKKLGTRSATKKTPTLISRVNVENITTANNKTVYLHYYDDKIVITAKEERVNWIAADTGKKK